MEDIRKIVKGALEELYQGVKYSYPTSSQNSFPYMGDDEGNIRLPEDINPEKEEYIYNNQLEASNDALQEFPMAEFHLGLKIERNRKNLFDILDVADIVIQRLRDNPNFYTEITNP